MKEHVLSLSYGKDSLACLGAIEQIGWPLDRIVTVDLWATDDIPADLPVMVNFKKKADALIKERFGITVEHVKGPYTAEQIIYRKRVRGNRAGQMLGWPKLKGCEIQSRCKRAPLSAAMKGSISYWGIAADEPERIQRHSKKSNVQMPLVEIGWSELDCRKWCEKNGLLSPVYADSARSGCWFCPQQRKDTLRVLRRKYPKYWAIMLQWDKDSPMTFRADGRTVHDYDKRFQLEDEGYLSADDRVFRWEMLDQELNRRLF